MNANRLELALAHEQDHALIILDIEGRVREWLAGAAALFGYGAAEMQGENLERIFTAEDLRRGELSWSLAAAADHGKADDDRWHVRKNGVHVWTSGVTSAIRDATGTLTGYVKVARDRTRLRNELASLEARLDEGARTISRQTVYIEKLVADTGRDQGSERVVRLPGVAA